THRSTDSPNAPALAAGAFVRLDQGARERARALVPTTETLGPPCRTAGTIVGMVQHVRLAGVAGDGIGSELVTQGLAVLEPDLRGSALAVSTTDFDLGAARWHKTGETLTDAALAAIREHDAILLGAVGDPHVPSGVLERGLLLRLRFELDHY